MSSNMQILDHRQSLVQLQLLFFCPAQFQLKIMAKIDEALGKLKTLEEEFRSTQSLKWKFQQVSHFVMVVKESNLEEFEIDDLLDKIELIDFPARRFKLELANLFKRPLIILEFLKTEDSELLKRALQFRWMFFSQESSLTKPKTLVRIILPNVSYNARRKIILKLSLHLQDERKCEEIFHLVKMKYGTIGAIPMVSSCSTELIRKLLTEDSKHLLPMLKKSQFLLIAKKDSHLGFAIAEEMFTISKAMRNVPAFEENISITRIISDFETKFNPTLEYLCLTNPNIFSTFFLRWTQLLRHWHWQWFCPEPSLTKSLVTEPNSKERVIQQALSFDKIMDPKTVKKCLTTSEFIIFFENLLPTTIEKFLQLGPQLVTKWLGKSQWDILEKAFLSKYEQPLSEFPECLVSLNYSADILIPLQIRGNVKCQFKKNELSKHEFLLWTISAEMNSGDIISKLNTLLENSGKDSCETMKSAVKWCLISGNLKTLMSILKHSFSNEKKNSKLQKCRSSLLHQLLCDFPHNRFVAALQTLPFEEKVKCLKIFEEHLKVKVSFVSDGDPLRKCSSLFHIILNIAFALEVKVDAWVEECYMKSVLHSRGTFAPTKSKCFSTSSHSHLLHFHDSILEKLFPLQLRLEHIDQNSLEFDTIRNSVLLVLQDFGERKKRKLFTLSEFPWFNARIREMIHNYYPEFFIYEDLIFLSRSSEIVLTEETILSLGISPSLLFTSLMQNPETILNRLEQVLDHILHQNEHSFKTVYGTFFQSVKIGCFTDLSAAIVEVCLLSAQDETLEEKVRCHAIKVLSVLWDPENFLASLSLFHPTSLQIEIQSDFETKPWVQQRVLASLKNVSTSGKCLSALRHFFKGHLTRVCIRPLQDLCFRAPQLEALKALQEQFLPTGTINGKMQVIHLITTISEVDETHELLLHLWDSESSPEIRDFIVKEVVNFLPSFSGNHEELKPFGAIIKEYVEEDLPQKISSSLFLNPIRLLCTDRKLLVWFLQTIYFSYDFSFCEMTLLQEIQIKAVTSFIKWVHKYLYKFPSAFLEHLAKRHFHSKEKPEIAMVVGTLLAGEETIKADGYIAKCLLSLVKKNTSGEVISTFVREKCENCLNISSNFSAVKNANMQTLEIVKNILTQNDYTDLKDLVIIRASKIILNHANGTSHRNGQEAILDQSINLQIAENLLKVVLEYMDLYGQHIASTLGKILQDFFLRICDMEQDSLLTLILHMVNGTSKENLVFVGLVLADFIPTSEPKTPASLLKYNQLLSKMRESKTLKVITAKNM